MPDPVDKTVQAQAMLLKELYEQGMLSKQDYQAKLTELGLDAATIFDQQRQQVEQQINVAGDFIQMGGDPGADPKALRRAYLHRLMQQTRRLPLTGVDRNAARGEGSQELQLSAVYTALLTQRPEFKKKYESKVRLFRLEYWVG